MHCSAYDDGDCQFVACSTHQWESNVCDACRWRLLHVAPIFLPLIITELCCYITFFVDVTLVYLSISVAKKHMQIYTQCISWWRVLRLAFSGEEARGSSDLPGVHRWRQNWQNSFPCWQGKNLLFFRSAALLFVLPYRKYVCIYILSYAQSLRDIIS